MSTTAEKLTYLNETKSKLKNNINLTGAGLTNQTPFRQYATDLKTALLNILNNGIDTLYNNFPKTTGTGTNISLNNTLQAPIRSVINGDTEQDGEPTPDNPKEIKSVTGLQKVKIHGKNLFSSELEQGARSNVDGTTLITSNNYVRTKTKIKVQPNTTYYISYLFPTGTSGDIQQYSDNTYLGRIALSNTSFTTPSNCNYINVQWFNNNGVEITDITNIQLEQGSSATTYEPYQSQEYDINLGKNLLPYDLAKLKSINDGGTWEGDVYKLYGVTYTYNEDGSLTLGGNATGLSYINLYSSNSKNLIGENTIYTYSKGITNTNILMAIYEYINNSWVSKKYVNTSSTTYTPSGEQTGQMIRILVNNGTDLSTPITIFPMIEKGSEATSYSPYFTPIELNKIGTYQDYISGTPDNWVINRQVGKKVLNGSEAWWSDGQTGIRRKRVNDIIESVGITISQEPYILSNLYIKTTANKTYIGNMGIAVGSSGTTILIYDPNYNTDDVTSFKQMLSSNNLKITYALATPITEPITNNELIEDLNNFYNKAKSYNGQTNISVEGDLQMILDVSAIIDE